MAVKLYDSIMLLSFFFFSFLKMENIFMYMGLYLGIFKHVLNVTVNILCKSMNMSFINPHLI